MERFGQQLADETKTAGPHSSADRELVLPGGASRQQQNGNIAASDQPTADPRLPNNRASVPPNSCM